MTTLQRVNAIKAGKLIALFPKTLFINPHKNSQSKILTITKNKSMLPPHIEIICRIFRDNL